MSTTAPVLESNTDLTTLVGYGDREYRYVSFASHLRTEFGPLFVNDLRDYTKEEFVNGYAKGDLPTKKLIEGWINHYHLEDRFKGESGFVVLHNTVVTASLQFILSPCRSQSRSTFLCIVTRCL